jgi:capsular polysaccharide export protein
VPGLPEYLARGIAVIERMFPTFHIEKRGGGMDLKEVVEIWLGETRRRHNKLDVGEIRCPYVFFPLQVEDDSQLLLHSPWVKSMEQAVRCLLEAIPKGIQLVVKRHPSDRGKTPLQEIRNLLEAHEGAFISQGTISDLLRESEAVVTINSSVGFEALTWYKPLVVLGQAAYARPGITWVVEEPKLLENRLRAALTSQTDRQRIDELLYMVLAQYMHPGSWKDPLAEELAPVATTILEHAQSDIKTAKDLNMYSKWAFKN